MAAPKPSSPGRVDVDAAYAELAEAGVLRLPEDPAEDGLVAYHGVLASIIARHGALVLLSTRVIRDLAGIRGRIATSKRILEAEIADAHKHEEVAAGKTKEERERLARNLVRDHVERVDALDREEESLAALRTVVDNHISHVRMAKELASRQLDLVAIQASVDGMGIPGDMGRRPAGVDTDDFKAP